jgi:GntR family transcriptional regulator
MIEFALDERSGAATYLQLVQQVHDALRLGLLEPGERLPTAISPSATIVRPRTGMYGI